MKFKKTYERNKPLLLNDKSICKANRDIFEKFFKFQEEKLKRINDNSKLDEPSYKTLVVYLNKLRNVNLWFENKAWVDLTLEDITKVYTDLEDGKITNRFGKRFEDRRGYYNKVFKYKPFELAGKKELVNEALTFFTDKRKKEVHFVNEKNFKKIIAVVKNPHHLALLHLSWDIGENINTLLQLTASNFKKQTTNQKEEEYLIWLPQDRLKRSRQQRSEPTLFIETVRCLDIILEGKKPNDKLFNFEYRQAKKFFDGAVKRSNAVCEPTGKKPSWKDLRSGMACNLFSKYGWHSDDINLRLGHSITSRELEPYFSYLAGQGKRIKKLHYNNNLEQVKEELDEIKLREKAQRKRMETQNKTMNTHEVIIEDLAQKVLYLTKSLRILNPEMNKIQKDKIKEIGNQYENKINTIAKKL